MNYLNARPDAGVAFDMSLGGRDFLHTIGIFLLYPLISNLFIYNNCYMF